MFHEIREHVHPHKVDQAVRTQQQHVLIRTQCKRNLVFTSLIITTAPSRFPMANI